METINEIKKIRSRLGLSQRALGEAIGKNRDAIKDIELGRKRLLVEDYLKIKELYKQLRKKRH